MNDLSQRKYKGKSRNSKKSSLHAKAGITIYITLMLVLILALTCTLIESGRVSAMRAGARSRVFMAADSAFAEFAQPVFDRYGIMFLWTDEEGFREIFDAYVKKTENGPETGAGSDLDLYGIRYLGSEMKGAEHITDNAGEPFARQVQEYMKVHAAEGIAETLLSNSGLLKQSEKAREILEKIEGYEKTFAKAEESAVKIYETTERIRDLSENPKSLLDEMEQLFSKPQEESVRDDFADRKKKWQQTEKKLQKEVSGLEKETETYYRDVSETKESVQKMQADLEEASFDPEIYDAIHSKVQHFADYGSDEGEQYRAITANAQTAKEWMESMGDMDSYFEETEAALERNDYEACRDLTAAYKEKMQTPNFSVTDVTDVASEGDVTSKPSAGFIRKVTQQYKKGLLDFFADEISDKQIEKETLPSVTCCQEKTEKDEATFAEQTVQKALFCEYIREHFNCFTEKKRDTVLDYEIEYILGGKKSDRENLSSVVAKLVLIRSGLNMVGLMTDAEKKAEIDELALAIAGATTMVYIAEIVEALILIAWATAEAMLDVRALLKGKKVPLIKKQGDWNFSLEGLQNFTGSEEPEKDSKNGLGYQEYLLLLLMLQGKTKQIFRTMDVIQMNMCAEETERFRMQNCLVGAQVEASFSAPAVFVTLPMVRRLIPAGGDGYRFTFLQDYHY